MAPYSVIYGVAPVSIILMLISYTYETVKKVFLTRLKTKKEEA